MLWARVLGAVFARPPGSAGARTLYTFAMAKRCIATQRMAVWKVSRASVYGALWRLPAGITVAHASPARGMTRAERLDLARVDGTVLIHVAMLAQALAGWQQNPMARAGERGNDGCRRCKAGEEEAQCARVSHG